MDGVVPGVTTVCVVPGVTTIEELLKLWITGIELVLLMMTGVGDD